MTGQTGQPTPAHEQLTPEQYEKVLPLLKLADVGRPVKLDEAAKPAELRRQERKAKALSALREHGTLSAAATVAGVSRATLYNWRESDPAFEAEVKQWLDEDMEAELHETLFVIAQKGRTDSKYANAAVRAAELLIKAENREKYGDQLKTEGTVTVNHLVQVALTARDTLREQQRQRLEQLQARTIDAPPLPPVE